MIIAIDGPAGSGKTTVSRLLAKQLGIGYLDTGATYRALTLKSLDEGVDLNDGEIISSLARKMSLRLEKGKVFLDGQDVTESIRTPLIDRNISLVVSHQQVRESMVELQRRLAEGGDYVVEGRDIGTVVFPDADFKFYLDADVSERARRRFNELKAKGIDLDFNEVLVQLKRRDQADLTRKVGPLRKAEDAIYIDTTGMSINEVVNCLVNRVKSSIKSDG